VERVIDHVGEALGRYLRPDDINTTLRTLRLRVSEQPSAKRSEEDTEAERPKKRAETRAPRVFPLWSRLAGKASEKTPQ
jgi:hypothetical protein